MKQKRVSWQDSGASEEEALLGELRARQDKQGKGAMFSRLRGAVLVLLFACVAASLWLVRMPDRESGADDGLRATIRIERALTKLREEQTRLLFATGTHKDDSLPTRGRSATEREEIKRALDSLRSGFDEMTRHTKKGEDTEPGKIQRKLLAYSQALERAVSLRELIGFNPQSGLSGEAKRLRKTLAQELPKSHFSLLDQNLRWMERAESSVLATGSVAARRDFTNAVLEFSFDLLRMGLPEQTRRRIEKTMDAYSSLVARIITEIRRLRDSEAELSRHLQTLREQARGFDKSAPEQNASPGLPPPTWKETLFSRSTLLAAILLLCLALVASLFFLGWRERRIVARDGMRQQVGSWEYQAHTPGTDRASFEDAEAENDADYFAPSPRAGRAGISRTGEYEADEDKARDALAGLAPDTGSEIAADQDGEEEEPPIPADPDRLWVERLAPLVVRIRLNPEKLEETREK